MFEEKEFVRSNPVKAGRCLLKNANFFIVKDANLCSCLLRFVTWLLDFDRVQNGLLTQGNNCLTQGYNCLTQGNNRLTQGNNC